MKKMISLVCLALIVAGTAMAQGKGGKKEWQEKVRAEKVGYLTAELNLTVEEAQVFWPVYNAAQEKRQEAFKTRRKAMKALEKALNTGEGDVTTLLNEYLKTQDVCAAAEKEFVGKFKGVIPVEKVAKLVLAEENFKHRQIGQLQHGNGPHPQGRHPGQNRNPNNPGLSRNPGQEAK